MNPARARRLMREQRRRAAALGELPDDLSSSMPGYDTADLTSKDYGDAPDLPPPVPAQRRPLRYHFGTKNGQTVNGAVQAVPANQTRDYAEFQNQSAVNDMRIDFGVGASANTGLLVPAGTSRIWDVKVPVDSISVWCAVAGQAWAVVEGVQVGAGVESEPAEAATSSVSAGGGGFVPRIL